MMATNIRWIQMTQVELQGINKKEEFVRRIEEAARSKHESTLMVIYHL